jgi:hypothetical protein
MKRTFVYEFDEDFKNSVTFQYSLEEDETISTSVEGNAPFLYLNRAAMITLAKILIKMAYGTYDKGFHVHLHKDFNADLPDCLTVLLQGSEPLRA